MGMIQKQTVYLPVRASNNKGEKFDLKSVIDGKPTSVIGAKEGYFFTPEQLNEYTQSVIKQALGTAAENAISEPFFIDGEPAYMSDRSPVDKQSITNTFEETYRLFSVD